jgi:hypothetical protein
MNDKVWFRLIPLFVRPVAQPGHTRFLATIGWRLITTLWIFDMAGSPTNNRSFSRSP